MTLFFLILCNRELLILCFLIKAYCDIPRFFIVIQKLSYFIIIFTFISLPLSLSLSFLLLRRVYYFFAIIVTDVFECSSYGQPSILRQILIFFQRNHRFYLLRNNFHHIFYRALQDGAEHFQSVGRNIHVLLQPPDLPGTDAIIFN